MSFRSFQIFDGCPEDWGEKTFGVLIHALPHGSFGGYILIVQEGAEEVVTPVLRNDNKIAFALSEKSTVAPHDIHTGNEINKGRPWLQE